MLTRFPAVFLITQITAIVFPLVFLCGVPAAFALHAGTEHEEERDRPEEVRHRPRESDLARMVKIPAGKFKMGSTFEENKKHLGICRKYDKSCSLWWFMDEYPDHLVHLDDYWIDIFEVTNEKYLEFVEATDHRPALDDSCATDECRQGNLWDGKSFPDRARRQPVTQVSWFDADAYCRWRGKRLPSEAEWEKAARGPSGNRYPWGAGSPRGRASYQRKWHGAFTMTDVGSFPNGASIYGVFDLAGNAWEWVNDWYHINYYRLAKNRRNPKGPANGDIKVVRGGSWVNYPDSLRSALRRWSRPQVRFNDTGFRCAKDDIDETQKD